jgi:hypothetical protein
MTGRLYEPADEMTTVHRHLPRAHLAGIVFLPVDACFDKAGQTSFAHVVLELRRRSGRDPADPAHLSRCDFAAAGLYSSGGASAAGRNIDRGVIRFFPVDQAPPRRELPPVGNTFSLTELTDRMLTGAIAGTAASDEYGEAEGGLAVAVTTALEDVVQAEAAGEVDETALDE